MLLQPFPEGASGPSFFQKRVPKNAPDWLQTTTVSTPNGTTSQALGAEHIHRVIVEVGHPQIAQQKSAVGMRVHAHAPVALRSEIGQLRHEPAMLIEEFLRLVALHPAFQLLHVVGMIGVHQQRNLMRPESALDLQAVDYFRSRPALGRPKDDHGPAGTSVSFVLRA